MTDLWLFECIWSSSEISAWIAVTSVSSENVDGVSVMIPVVILVSIPGLDFLVAELSGIEVVLESLTDCVGAVDTVRSLFSLNSSCELLAKPGARVNLYSWWLCSKNYWFLSDLTYLKCWKYLFEIVLLLPWAEILGMGNLE